MPTADSLINTATIHVLVRVFRDAKQPAASWTAVLAAADELSALSLSERARVVATGIVADIGGFAELAAITRTALSDSRLSGWQVWPLTEAIATTATARRDAGEFDEGLELLAALTPRLTSEFALRTFLNADLERTLAIVEKWTAHDDAAVRRLASEGTRPKLPWAKQLRELIADPGRTRRILDSLYQDESEFVRRSVANHLNDVSRLDPAGALAAASAWAADGDPRTQQVIRHAMRTLIKSGDPDALRLMGFHIDPEHVRVTGPRLARTDVNMGEAITFTADIANLGEHTANLVIDYVIHHRKANGGTTAKVFKLTTRTLEPDESVTLTRRHLFKPITTRRYYAGIHGLEIQVNGQRHGYTDFTLAEWAATSVTRAGSWRPSGRYDSPLH